ncbi:putative proteasome regulatory particle subunit protein [Venustampulla echinocandica]|uniref:Putative proteasome regulatory particle subunit protein n=1 Tax=Venustampulla echinocandica TaxID=2656787 RepID=A0A370U2L3_9HELO|nr:putative proteasome regulatory particle subunit protein [Venustampulla echinocandica]RDL42024.1 putative proteasome regulatory particle subunit protein [Venustampulla echinocandica]
MEEAPSKYAIHEAAREGRTIVVESLLNANPKLADLKDEDERLPIHWAISNGHLDIAVLLSAGKNFDPDVQDGSGWTPLMIAVSLKEGDALVDLLLRKGADINATNFTGQSALHFIASKNNLDLARKLLDAKPPASVRVRDKRGQYPIHRAAAVGSVPMVELFVKNKSPLNATDVAGQTPLHHAIAEGHGDAAVALLKAGAETDKKDVDGFVAMDLAPDSNVKKFILQAAEREGIVL